MILRRTGIAALVVSLSAGMTSNLLFLAAFQFRLDMFLEPTLILGSAATSAELLRWAAVLDLFGYYLATAVLACVLWRQLRPRNLLIADLSTMAAVGYALAGGMGAAVLAAAASTSDRRGDTQRGPEPRSVSGDNAPPSTKNRIPRGVTSSRNSPAQRTLALHRLRTRICPSSSMPRSRSRMQSRRSCGQCRSRYRERSRRELYPVPKGHCRERHCRNSDSGLS